VSDHVEPFAWHGRFIVRQDGYADLPPDRQEVRGAPSDTDKTNLLAELNALMDLKMMKKIIVAKLKSGEIHTRERKDVVLIQDRGLLIRGNANASAGYFYVTACRAIRTEDGEVAVQGDRVFNYYEGFWGTLGPIDDDGWADVFSDDGRRAYLNGQRISTYDPRGTTDPKAAS
jgi:hypothetical protein